MPDLIQNLTGPRTAQQELFYDLEDSASIIGWAVNQLSTMAQTTTDGNAPALTKICDLLLAEQNKLSRYADEVKAGSILRTVD